MNQQTDSKQLLMNMLLCEMFAVSSLQNAALEGDEEATAAAMALPSRTLSLANLSAAIAHLNKGDVAQIDTDSLDEAWLKLKLESSMASTACPNTERNTEGVDQ